MNLRARLWSGEVVQAEIGAGRYQRLEIVTGETDAALPFLAPGLIDLQINGFAGIDFNHPTVSEDDWHLATERLYAQGCTGFLLTLITHTEEATRHWLREWTARLRRNSRNCLGFHLEGPWLNPDPGTRGAHRAEWMVPPSLAQLQEWREIAGDYLKLITLAPEIDPEKSEQVIRAGKAAGVQFFIGHSLAMGEVLDRAVAAGALGWTHLGNAAPSPAPKFENVIFHALGRPGLLASLIPDGVHLPPHAFQALTHALGDRLLLTTDAMAGAGAAPGRYTLGETEVVVGQDGSARLPDSGRLAGSTLTPLQGVLQANRMSQLGLEKIWTAFSTRPAQVLKINHGLAVGQPADFCLLADDHDCRLLATYQQGREVYRAA